METTSCRCAPHLQEMIFKYTPEQKGKQMKIERLIGILSILLQRDSVTAPELAEQFEVSRRTISRDIDDLCRAGIPVVTRQGSSGGISIMKNYRFDRTLLTRTELQDILAGRKTEKDMFAGTVIRMGKELGIPTPYNEFLYDALTVLEEKNAGTVEGI